MKYCTTAQVWANIQARGANTHKGDYGNVLLIAGSEHYRGAAALCALGALRSGAGLVSLSAPECVINSVAAQILEATFMSRNSNELFAAAQKADCVAIGCGMYNNNDTAQLVAQLLPLCKKVILDAGALSAIASNLHVLQTAAGEVIITPHLGEMSTLCGKSIDEIKITREQTALSFALQHNVTVLLKGHHSIIATPAGDAWQNPTGNAGLARGGSGDVLTGIISGLFANGMTSENATVIGAYLHGLAADICAARLSKQGMLPHDILTDLCTIFKENGR